MSKILKSDYLLFYILWPLIVSPKEVQFALLGVLLVLVLSRTKIYFDWVAYLTIFYITIYLFSITYNSIFSLFSSERILATLNSLFIWIIGLLFYLAMKNSTISFKNLTKIAFINYSILIGLWLVSVFLYHVAGLREVLILGRVLHYSEWFNDHEVFRFVSFMEYPNLIVMFFLFIYPLYYWHLKSYQNKFLRFLFVLIGILPIFSTYSRSGYLIIVAGIILFVFIHIFKKIERKKFIILTCTTLSILILLFVYSSVKDSIYLTIEELAQAREGSNESRSYLMLESIRVSFDNSPLIGMGIKNRSVLGYPLGSHSTYIGFIYKTGIVGFVIGIALFIVINIRILLLKISGSQQIVKISLILMTILLAVEDIDGANWLIVLYFTFVGLLLNNKPAS